MAFRGKDNQDFNEVVDAVVTTAVTKGEPVIKGDVFGFYNNAVTTEDIAASDANVIIYYKMRQVEADKITGTGEDIVGGEKLYHYPASDAVSKTPTGVAGTDYYFCGWAKDAAAASVATVLMEFDGTRYQEAI